jgi:hypothetical protein
MTVKEMLDLGWTPSKVIALRWVCDGAEVEVAAPHGIHGIVVEGANFVAAIRDEPETNAECRLVIFLPDGNMHAVLENRLSVSGREYNGNFSWFEQAMTPPIDTFGAIFQSDRQEELRCDVDASGARVLNVTRVR